jgi:hypothetical protein
MKMRLFKRAAVKNLPLAISVKTSGKFEEDDGLWSSFDLEIGDGPGGGQNFRVIISTSSFDTWLPLPPGCPNETFTPPNCAYSRGVDLYAGLQSSGYNGADSNTAAPKGQLSTVKLEVGELDASSLFGATYGDVAGALWADYLHMSSSTGSDTSQNSSQPVPILGVKRVPYYLSTFGIGVGAHKTPVASLPIINSTVLSMANAGAIPSESWGYTAGAHYGKCTSISNTCGPKTSTLGKGSN